MLVTLLGIVTEVKPEQYLKAQSPMLVTPLGIVTEVKPEQPWNFLSVITQQFTSKTAEINTFGFNIDSKSAKLTNLTFIYIGYPTIQWQW